MTAHYRPTALGHLDDPQRLSLANIKIEEDATGRVHIVIDAERTAINGSALIQSMVPQDNKEYYLPELRRADVPSPGPQQLLGSSHSAQADRLEMTVIKQEVQELKALVKQMATSQIRQIDSQPTQAEIQAWQDLGKTGIASFDRTFIALARALGFHHHILTPVMGIIMASFSVYLGVKVAPLIWYQLTSSTLSEEQVATGESLDLEVLARSPPWLNPPA